MISLVAEITASQTQKLTMVRKWWSPWAFGSPFTTACLVSYFFFAMFYVRAEKREVSYKTPVKFVVRGDGTQQSSQPARSKLECAVRCSENKDCTTFHFNESNGNCLTKNGVIDDSIGDVYGLKIPHISGYVLYEQLGGQKNLYLKIENAAIVDMPTAASICAADGGHLLVIEDKSMLEFIRDILRAGTDGAYWIDGEDPNGSGNYKTWNGETSPYIGWSSFDPDETGPACIRLMKRHDYLVGDKRCHHSFGYICQVDI